MMMKQEADSLLVSITGGHLKKNGSHVELIYWANSKFCVKWPTRGVFAPILVLAFTKCTIVVENHINLHCYIVLCVNHTVVLTISPVYRGSDSLSLYTFLCRLSSLVFVSCMNQTVVLTISPVYRGSDSLGLHLVQTASLIFCINHV